MPTQQKQPPSPQRSGIGGRVRAQRLALGLSQADLAARAGISASYLNLIEHDRRRIGGRRLADLARQLGVEQGVLASEPAPALLAALEAIAPGARTQAFAEREPIWARRLSEQHEAIAALEDRLAAQQGLMARDPALVEALHQIVTSASAIQSTAAILVGGGLDADWQARFQHNVHDDSQRLAAASEALMRYVERLGDVRREDPATEVADWLERAGHHVPDLETDPPGPADDMAVRAARVGRVGAVDKVVGAAGLSQAGSQLLARWLGRYADDARHLPRHVLMAALADHGIAPLQLAGHLGVPLDLLLRRLAVLPPGEGFPAIGLAICDGAGVLTMQRPVPGFALPQAGGCPLWPLYQALCSPGRAVRAVVAMPDAAPVTAYAIAYAVDSAVGQEVGDLSRTEATMLVVTGAAAADTSSDLATSDTVSGPRRVGATCRQCPRAACPARREPAAVADPARAAADRPADRPADQTAD